MEDTFNVIEKLPKGEQFSILLELLQEKGDVLNSQRLDSFYRRLSPAEAMKQLQIDWLNCERIKQKLKQLYNENISNELPVQNIAQP